MLKCTEKLEVWLKQILKIAELNDDLKIQFSFLKQNISQDIFP
jgi:hypothetical protein